MEPEANVLCNFCAGLIFPDEESSPSRAHHPNIGLLERSSQSCLICRVFSWEQSLSGNQQNHPDIDRAAYESSGFEIRLKKIQRMSTGVSWALLEIRVLIQTTTYISSFSITTCNTKSISAGQPIWRAATTSIPDKIATVQSWLHNCQLNHQNCKPLVRRMPKRLIDVGSLSRRPPRIVMSENLHNQDIRYTTLSYCWGNANFCTTKENEDSYKQEIPFQLIPRTLQDALTLTRNLHIQYIWIDALCIVQDNHDEWEIEASRMQDIYSGSSITIAATDAADSSVGCYSHEHSYSDEAGAFLTTTNTKRDLGAIVRVQPYDIRTPGRYSVLNTRGWVLQELVLSHRTVHCTRNGLYWECRSECRTETGLVFDRSAKHESLIPILPQNIQIGVNEIWWRWMESYSRRRFSFPRDRLPALSGIVEYYQLATKDVPILGLWERSFHQDLLWMRYANVPENVGPTSSHLSNIPSWTWLSCPYGISYDFWNTSKWEDEPGHDLHDHVNLVEWAVAWASQPFVSNIKSSRLVLEGPMQEIRLSVTPSGKTRNPPILTVNDEKPDTEHSPSISRCEGQFDSGPRMSPTQYSCLLLRSAEYKYVSFVRETFLILDPCLTTNVYRRVGIGCFVWSSRKFDLTVRRTINLV